MTRHCLSRCVFLLPVCCCTSSCGPRLQLIDTRLYFDIDEAFACGRYTVEGTSRTSFGLDARDDHIGLSPTLPSVSMLPSLPPRVALLTSTVLSSSYSTSLKLIYATDVDRVLTPTTIHAIRFMIMAAVAQVFMLLPSMSKTRGGVMILRVLARRSRARFLGDGGR